MRMLLLLLYTYTMVHGWHYLVCIISHPSQDETTPIMVAVQAGNANVVELLKTKYGQDEPSTEEVLCCLL